MKLNRENPPSTYKEINFTLPDIQKFKLNNGSNVYFVKKDNLPITQIALISNAGSKFDANEKKGTASLLSALIDEGADGLNSLELNDKFETLGTILSISNNQDSFIFSLLTLNDNLDESLNLFSKVVISPNLNDEDFLREKRKLETKIIQSKDNPSYIAGTVFDKLIFGKNNPFGISEIGNLHTVQSNTLTDVKQFYSSLIVPSNSTFIITANIEKEIIEEKLNHFFSNWHDSTPPLYNFKDVKLKNSKVYIVDKKDAPQSEIILGHISTGRHTNDFFSKQLMNIILGGQFTSRINLNLREDKGFTYGAHSGFDYNMYNSVFSVGCAVDNENTGAAISEIIKELNGIKLEIKDEELEFAKSSVMRKYPSMFETYGHIARSLANLVIYSLPDNYYNTYLNKIKNVNLEQVLQAANNNIFPESLVILVVGNQEKVFQQLINLDLGSVSVLNDEGNLIK